MGSGNMSPLVTAYGRPGWMPPLPVPGESLPGYPGLVTAYGRPGWAPPLPVPGESLPGPVPKRGQWIPEPPRQMSWRSGWGPSGQVAGTLTVSEPIVLTSKNYLVGAAVGTVLGAALGAIGMHLSMRKKRK